VQPPHTKVVRSGGGLVASRILAATGLYFGTCVCQAIAGARGSKSKRRWGSLRATVRPPEEAKMDNTTLLIIILIVVILLGGGWYGRGRWF
jgi:hypothetical protein